MPDFKPDESRLNKLFDMHLICVLFTVLQLGIVLETFLILDPVGVLFVGAVIPSQGLFLPLKLFAFLMNFYLIIVVCVSGALLYICGSMYGFYVTYFYLTELRLGRNPNKYLMANKIRSDPHILRKIFRAFQLLHRQLLCRFGPYVLSLDGAFMTCSIFVTLNLIRHWKQLETYAKALLVIGNFLILLSWTFVMELGRIMFIVGNKVINSWKGDKWSTKEENMIMNRFSRSSKPLLIAYGTQFVLKKSSLFVFYRGVVRGTFRALLAIK